MKKLILLFLCVAAIHVSTQAGNDRPISFDQLPAQSQQMIKKYFPNQSVALVKMEREFWEKAMKSFSPMEIKRNLTGKGSGKRLIASTRNFLRK